VWKYHANRSSLWAIPELGLTECLFDPVSYHGIQAREKEGNESLCHIPISRSRIRMNIGRHLVERQLGKPVRLRKQRYEAMVEVHRVSG
jgi:hypothetical protein